MWSLRINKRRIPKIWSGCSSVSHSPFLSEKQGPFRILVLTDIYYCLNYIWHHILVWPSHLNDILISLLVGFTHRQYLHHSRVLCLLLDSPLINLRQLYKTSGYENFIGYSSWSEEYGSIFQTCCGFFSFVSLNPENSYLALWDGKWWIVVVRGSIQTWTFGSDSWMGEGKRLGGTRYSLQSENCKHFIITL